MWFQLAPFIVKSQGSENYYYSKFNFYMYYINVCVLIYTQKYKNICIFLNPVLVRSGICMPS